MERVTVHKGRAKNRKKLKSYWKSSSRPSSIEIITANAIDEINLFNLTSRPANTLPFKLFLKTLCISEK